MLRPKSVFVQILRSLLRRHVLLGWAWARALLLRQRLLSEEHLTSRPTIRVRCAGELPAAKLRARGHLVPACGILPLLCGPHMLRQLHVRRLMAETWLRRAVNPSSSTRPILLAKRW